MSTNEHRPLFQTPQRLPPSVLHSMNFFSSEPYY